VPLVPDDFDVPLRHETADFTLEPLGPEHNERDHAAWTSSIEHIRATHGFEDRRWPVPMSLDDNLRDLEQHRTEFDQRIAFAYSVLDPETEDVIGCVYVNPAPSGDGAIVRTWVRATHAQLDERLRTEVVDWLRRDWPLASVTT
jgi:RimJ/RimL family protein N-acetyltransferase